MAKGQQGQRFGLLARTHNGSWLQLFGLHVGFWLVGQLLPLMEERSIRETIFFKEYK